MCRWTYFHIHLITVPNYPLDSLSGLDLHLLSPNVLSLKMAMIRMFISVLMQVSFAVHSEKAKIRSCVSRWNPLLNTEAKTSCLEGNLNFYSKKKPSQREVSFHIQGRRDYFIPSITWNASHPSHTGEYPLMDANIFSNSPVWGEVCAEQTLCLWNGKALWV